VSRQFLYRFLNRNQFLFVCRHTTVNTGMTLQKRRINLPRWRLQEHLRTLVFVLQFRCKQGVPNLDSENPILYKIFFDYGLPVSTREMESGFPLVGTLASSLVRKLVVVFQSFPAAIRPVLSAALVKDRNPLGCSASGKNFTTDEQHLVKEFRARFAHVPMGELQMYSATPLMSLPAIDFRALDASYRPLRIRPPKRDDIRKIALSDLRQKHGRRVVKVGENEYETKLGGKTDVVVGLDFGGWDQIRFDFSLIAEKSPSLARQRFSLGDILGYGDLPTDELSIPHFAQQISTLVDTICSVQEDLLASLKR
jgi:hypothetical protein